MIGVWLLSVVGALVISILGEGFIDRVKSVEAFGPRLEGAKIAMNMVKSHPFAGVGLNNFAIVMRERNYAEGGVSSLQQAYFQGEYFGTVVHNKYFVDEAYDFLFVRGTLKLGGFLLKVADGWIIEGLINGTAEALQRAGGRLRKVETGYVQEYAFAIIVGAILVVGYLVVIPMF